MLNWAWIVGWFLSPSLVFLYIVTSVGLVGLQSKPKPTDTAVFHTSHPQIDPFYPKGHFCRGSGGFIWAEILWTPTVMYHPCHRSRAIMFLTEVISQRRYRPLLQFFFYKSKNCIKGAQGVPQPEYKIHREQRENYIRMVKQNTT